MTNKNNVTKQNNKEWKKDIMTFGIILLTAGLITLTINYFLIVSDLHKVHHIIEYFIEYGLVTSSLLGLWFMLTSIIEDVMKKG